MKALLALFLVVGLPRAETNVTVSGRQSKSGPPASSAGGEVVAGTPVQTQGCHLFWALPRPQVGLGNWGAED